MHPVPACQYLTTRRARTLLLGWLLLLTPLALAAPPKLTIWSHPYLTAAEITDRFTPLTRYLAASLDREVEIRVQKSYQEHIDFVGADRADIAYMGPASYVRLRAAFGPKPLLARLEIKGSAAYAGMIIAHKNTPFKELNDLRGHSFAFGDPNSTMSHLVPRAMLTRAGVALDSLKEHRFLGSHQDVALAVLGGYFDAGAVKEEVFYEYQNRGLKLIAESPQISEHLFLTRGNLDPKLIDRVRTLLLDMATKPAGREALRTIKSSVTALIPVTDSDYDPLRKLMRP